MSGQSDSSSQVNATAEETGEPEIKKLKTKFLPALMMLLGGAAASIVTYINHYDIKRMLIIVLITLIVFLMLGLLLKKLFDSFKIVSKVPDEEVSEAVIQKKVEENEE